MSLIKKHVLTVLLCCATLSAFSQKVIAYSDMTLKNKRESIPIINTKTNELSLFVTDRKKIYFSKYNKEFELIDQQTFDRPKSNLKNIIEKANTAEHEYLFLLADNLKEKFGLLKLNPQQKTGEILNENIHFNEDKYLNAFSHKNQIYVITIKADQSILGIHKINANGSLESLVYDLTNEEFFDKKNRTVSLYKALLHRANSIDPGRLTLEYIETTIPNSLEKTSKKAKLFINGNKIRVLLDQSNKFSQIITLNLDSTNYEVNNLKKVVLSDYSNIKSNSFLSKNNLYQLIASKERMKFIVTNINTKELVKEVHLTQKDSITFKNTPIVQEGGYYDNHREMEKTKKFLRKITSSNVGVSVYQSNDTIQVTLGGIKEYAVGGGGFSGPGFMPVAGGSGITFAYAPPVFQAYSSYAGTKSTYIKCLFDENLSHLTGDVPSNVFDKIKEFKNQILDENTETIFKFENHIIHGYYLHRHHKYYLRKYSK